METLEEMIDMLQKELSDRKSLDRFTEQSSPVTYQCIVRPHKKVTEYQFTFHYQGWHIDGMIREMDGPFIIFGVKCLTGMVAHPFYMVNGKLVAKTLPDNISTGINNTFNELIRLVKIENRK